jgi:RHS repeat-associated protein
MNRNRYYTIITLILLVAFGQAVNAQDKHGFVQREIVKIPGITTDAAINALSNTQKQTTRAYTDGMGRTLQTVGVDASPLQNDMIQPVAYDNLGRQIKAYLPYAGQAADTIGVFRNNALTTGQKAFYNQTSQYLIATDTNAFTQQVFENSPLQRMLKSGTVGVGFQPLSGQHFKTVSYRYNNTAQDGNIIVWNPDGTFTTSNYYAASTLSVRDGIDEDNAETLTFTDKIGHMVLKRQKLGAANLDTYYIYNLAGMISYIVPPKAVSLMGGTPNLATAGVNKLIYHYVYDNLGRPVEKTIPVMGRLFIVYDPLNRPVLMQDSNMRIANKWNYIKYDVKGRTISQGIYTDATRISRATMQTYVSGLASSYNTAWYETRTATLTNNGYYTSVIFPTGSTGTLTPLAYAYFDDYDVDLNGTANFSYVPQGLPGEANPAATTAAVKDMPTAICKTTVGSGVSGTWLTKVAFYDKRGNPVQTQSNNHMYYSGMLTLTDKSTTVPDFMGVPQVNQVSKQTGASTTITVQTSFTYDHMNRVKTVSQGYNGAAATVVAAYTYNELGQVVKKSLGFVSAGTYLQNLDMRYNVRGQLLSINNSKLSNDAGQTNGDTNDLFGLQMLYDKTDANLGNTAYYNGKLSAVKWMSKDASGTQSNERSYIYLYDEADRYRAANYAERIPAGTGAFTVNSNAYNESSVTYDPNGNILTLNRNAYISTSGTINAIDHLNYTYSTDNPNQLSSVTDNIGSNYVNYGFRNLTGTTTGTYSYDGNGNMTADPFKGLSIAYNQLNRTDKITVTTSTGRFINYTYDAGGNLIRKQVYDNNVLGNTTDYIDGFVYLNGTLQYFAMPEGRVLNSAGTLSREFTIADQQGNIRITFDNTGAGGTAKVRQENSYYGFGLIMPSSAVSTPGNDNKHLYNGGSEWQNDYSSLPDYYQTYYRNYDAAIGRWVGVDPNPNSAENMTVYQYAGNNPILYNDPLGDRTEYQDYGKASIAGTSVESRMNEWLDTFAASAAAYMNRNDNALIPDITGIAGAVMYNIYTKGDDSHPSTGLSSAALGSLVSGIGSSTGVSVNLESNNWYSIVTNHAQTDVATGTYILGGVTNEAWGYARSTAANVQANQGEPGDDFGFSVAATRLSDGAFFIANFKDPGYGYKSYNWIQTVSSSGEYDKQLGISLPQPHVDGPRGHNGQLLDPLFIFGSGNPENIHTGMTSTFLDRPSGETWFSAEATLVGISGNGSITPLGSFSWGYSQGNPNIIGPTFSLFPSAFQQTLINNFNQPH